MRACVKRGREIDDDDSDRFHIALIAPSTHYTLVAGASK